MRAVVINCAGNGTRFGKNKLLEPLHGKPIFIRTVKQFIKAGVAEDIIVTVREECREIYKSILGEEKLRVRLVLGGEKRYLSAYRGVEETKADKVLIHDGARPLVPQALIREVARALETKCAVMAAYPADTCVKVVQKDRVSQHLKRSCSYLGQTPHGFNRQLIIKAYKKAIRENLDGMDDAELVAELGQDVYVVEGNRNNIKITTPVDLLLAEKIWESDVNEYS